MQIDIGEGLQSSPNDRGVSEVVGFDSYLQSAGGPLSWELGVWGTNVLLPAGDFSTDKETKAGLKV